jgi:hypothetical protein
MLHAGEVIYIYWHQARKDKYLICIDEPQSLFMVINTDPWSAATAPSQVRVTPSEIPCLQHPSHINTAQLVRASPIELSVLTSAPQRNHGSLTRAVIDLIKMAVAAHGILPADQASMVANL